MLKKKTFKIIGIFLIVTIVLGIFFILVGVLNKDTLPPDKVPFLVEENLIPSNPSEETYVPPLEENLIPSNPSEETYVPPLEELN